MSAVETLMNMRARKSSASKRTKTLKVVAAILVIVLVVVFITLWVKRTRVQDVTNKPVSTQRPTTLVRSDAPGSISVGRGRFSRLFGKIKSN